MGGMVVETPICVSSLDGSGCVGMLLLLLVLFNDETQICVFTPL